MAWKKCFVPECRLKRGDDSRYCEAHDAQWTSLSRRLRAQTDFCQHCGQPDWCERRLVTHHKRYVPGRHFDTELLEVICDECHAKADDLRRALTHLLQVPQHVVERFWL